ncbi:MAG: hypothetical protein H0V82_12145 [Candidatus Protochlamydia sp.]|nr:hypothetical protein [Candidatus Protochlamydia sp.]
MEKNIIQCGFKEKHRNFSYRLKSNSFEQELNHEIANAVEKYHNFYNLKNTEKIQLLIEKQIDRIFIAIKLDDMCTDQFSEKWFFLQNLLKEQAKNNPNLPLLPDFNYKDIYDNQTSLDILLLLGKIFFQSQYYEFEKCNRRTLVIQKSNNSFYPIHGWQ